MADRVRGLTGRDYERWRVGGEVLGLPLSHQMALWVLVDAFPEMSAECSACGELLGSDVTVCVETDTARRRLELTLLHEVCADDHVSSGASVSVHEPLPN